MPILAGDAEVRGFPHGFPAGMHAELGHDRGDVMRDGPRREIEPLGDLGVGQVLGDQRQNLHLSPGQKGRVCPCRRPGTARDAASTDFAQSLSDESRRRSSAQAHELGVRATE